MNLPNPKPQRWPGLDLPPIEPGQGRRHFLKAWPTLYKAAVSGEKTFEIRNNDRDFQPGDTLVLREFDPDLDAYTGQLAQFKVTFCLYGDGFTQRFGIQPGHVAMSIVPLTPPAPRTPNPAP